MLSVGPCMPSEGPCIQPLPDNDYACTVSIPVPCWFEGSGSKLVCEVLDITAKVLMGSV